MFRQIITAIETLQKNNLIPNNLLKKHDELIDFSTE